MSSDLLVDCGWKERPLPKPRIEGFTVWNCSRSWASNLPASQSKGSHLLNLAALLQQAFGTDFRPEAMRCPSPHSRAPEVIARRLALPRDEPACQTLNNSHITGAFKQSSCIILLHALYLSHSPGKARSSISACQEGHSYHHLQHRCY